MKAESPQTHPRLDRSNPVLSREISSHMHPTLPWNLERQAELNQNEFCFSAEEFVVNRETMYSKSCTDHGFSFTYGV